MAAWASVGVSDEVEATIQQSLAICRQVGHHLQTSHRRAMLAMLANDRQEYAGARRYAKEGVALAQAVGNPNFAIQNLCCLAEVAHHPTAWAIFRHQATRLFTQSLCHHLYSQVALSGPQPLFG